MILLGVESITKHYGPEPVLAGATFDVRPGERIGLVGPNGAGKSTLLRIIAGQEQADGGSLELHTSARLAYLEQQPDFAPGQTLWDVARDALAELIELAHEAEAVAHRLAEAHDDPQEHRRLAQQFDRLHHELHQRDAYHLDHRIERVLTGLGFRQENFGQPVEQLSGGQQNRLLLARLFLSGADLLLLDEPSNHLDVEATEWLENYLAACPQAMLLVSHDRYFLDKVTNRTLELYDGTVDSYTGNFSAYWRQKAERVEVERRAFEKQQELIAKTEDFIRRNSYGQKHAQAEDRRKKLARIELVAAPRMIEAPPMGFPPASRTGDIVARIEHLAKSYDRALFDDLSFDILRGERWGILGPNGSGKTTFLRCLVGEVEPDRGRVVLGTGVRVGYFDQRLIGLAPEAQVVDAIRPAGKEFNIQQRRDMLARFGLGGDLALQRVDSLSGGERNRASLARLAASDANFLVLDEPTNHLDLWARDALERALSQFDGSVLLVSHDRYFLNRVVDHLLVVEPTRFRVIEGNYETYQALVRAAAEETAARNDRAATSAAASKSADRRERSARTEKPKRKFPYRKLGDLEAEIAQREAAIEQAHEALTRPDVLRDGDAVRRLNRELEENRTALATLYAHWEEAAELNS